MKIRGIHKFWPGCLLAIPLALIFGLVNGLGPCAHENDAFALQPPPFVSAGKAEQGSGSSFLEREAGISAYVQASTTIDLDDVRGLFRTIEMRTDEYIVGSVPVTNYGETEDVHMYVHTDGWILAYYLAADPVGKIFDWRAYHDGGRRTISTKLENTIARIATEAGVSFSSVTYYDFRYPNATHMMLIVEWTHKGQDSCEINLPGSFAYYERSWSLGSDNGGGYRLNGERIGGNGWGWQTSQGTINETKLPPDQFHTILASGGVSGNEYIYAGLALVYRMPQ